MSISQKALLGRLSKIRKGGQRMERQLDRLRKGQAWLVDAHARLLAMRDLGIGSSEEARFLIALSCWDDLELMVRFVYDYVGCVIGEKGCDPDSPVVCKACEVKA